MSAARAAVVVFPGSNCDQDCVRSWRAATGGRAELVWHKEASLPNYDVVIIPGGFSFGDYLRSGAIARYSPVMNEVIRLAGRGSRVIGICNGFQILTEARLLPGALLRNQGLVYICKDTYLKVETAATDFTSLYRAGQVIKLPIGHGEGRYSIAPGGLKRLQDEDRVAFRYCRPDGTADGTTAPNGSLDNIAGIVSEKRNVLGMMPHPERLGEKILGGDDGRLVFQAILKAVGGNL